MIWDIVKNAAADVWDEMLYLMIFNIIWVVITIPGLWLIVQGTTLAFLPFILLGVILLLPCSFVLFGLIFTVYDIGEAKGIGLGTFWKHIHQNWRQAYLWGAINLAVGVIAWVNWFFYAQVEAEWAGFAQMVVLALGLLWLILQLLALAFYPRLERPGFKLALRNAGVVLGRYPLAGIFLLIVVLLIAAVASFFPIIYFLGAFSIIAVIANRVVAAILAKEKRREEEREA
jgi:uncharacterized membrane protein YesL